MTNVKTIRLSGFQETTLSSTEIIRAWFVHGLLLLIQIDEKLSTFTARRYEGSRRQEFIRRFKGWWKAIRRAYQYSHSKDGAKHKFRRFQKNVSQNTPDSSRVYSTKKTPVRERYTGNRRNPDNSAYKGARRMPRQPWNLLKDTSTPVPCVDTRTADGLICMPLIHTAEMPLVLATPVDPWHEYMLRQQRNNTLTLTGQEGPHQNVSHTSSVLGRRQDSTGQNPGTTQQMHPRQGGSDHHRPGGQTHSGGGLQRPAIGLESRLKSVYDVVSAGRIPSREPAHRAVPRVRRLSLTAR